MNIRINELAIQAKFMAEETINKKISKNSELDAFAEKFADLIIKDCIDVVNVWSEEEKRSEGYDIHTVYKIKQHFGIEDD